MTHRFCQTTRRGFLVGCSAAIAGLAGSRFNSLAFAQAGDINDEILIVLFLRGGQDGLNLVLPTGGADRAVYQSLRPTLQVPAAEAQPYTLGAMAGANGAVELALHPAAAPLHELFQDQKLAIVVAAGMAANERSHFDSMAWMELGTPGSSHLPTGWLTRHMQTASNLPAEILMPSLSVGGLQAMSQLGSYETINLSSVSDFSLNRGPWSARTDQRQALRNLLEGDSTWLHQAGLQALDAADLVELYASGGYTPAPGAAYPDSWFGDNLQTVAQMIKLDLGLRVATLDLGGWDHHENEEGIFAPLVDELARGLQAFWADLAGGPTDHTQRLTIVVQSEFGRRVHENEARGTDHGHGNNMLVLSGNAVGGLHGSWPGLAADLLNDGDLEVTTDFRRVLSEIVVRRLGNPNVDLVFPGYSGYAPMGVVQGIDLPVGQLFRDGFEAGGLQNWSAVG
jgi:uncharacterized protein (DUF1501 family)